MTTCKVWTTLRGRPPIKATKNSTGYDVYAAETISIIPGKVTKVKTGLHLEPDPTLDLQLRCRSSLASKGIVLPGGVHTIDPDYRGELFVPLISLTDQHVVNEGDRIAQIVFTQVVHPTINQVKELKDLSQTERGVGGFGSTGQ